MGMKRIVGALVLVGLLLFLALYQVEVTPMDDHTGAVAYIQPSVGSTYSAYKFTQSSFFESIGDARHFTITSMNVSITPGTIQEYVAPAPVRKPLWQAILNPGSLIPIGNSTGDGVIIGGGSGCTNTPLDIETFTVQTMVKITVTEPGNSQTKYDTPWATTTIKNYATRSQCSTISQSGIYSSQFSDPVTYEVGTYYFTKGFGDYLFSLELYIKDGAADPVQVGTTSAKVSLTQGSF